MENESVSRVQESLGLFLRLVWAFGVPDIRVRFIWRIMYTLFLGLIFFVMSYLSFDTRTGFVSSYGSKDGRAFLITELVVFISLHVMTIVWLTRGARAVWEAMTSLAKVDDVMKDLALPFPKTEHFRSLKFWLAVQLLFSFMLISFHFVVSDNSTLTDPLILLTNILYHLSSNVPGIQYALFGILFSSFIQTIRFRFSYINYQLFKMGKTYDENLIPINHLRLHERRKSFKLFNHWRMLIEQNCDMDRILRELNILEKMHKQLCEITVKLTAAFSPCLVMTLTVVLLQCMEHAAFFILLQETETSQKSCVAASSVLGIVGNIFKCWTVVSSCDDLSIEANRFGIMLHQIDVTDLAFRQKLHEYSIRHYQEKLVITAGGVFRLNVSCLTYIISTLTAYSVFIYQLNTTQNNVLVE